MKVSECCGRTSKRRYTFARSVRVSSRCEQVAFIERHDPIILFLTYGYRPGTDLPQRAPGPCASRNRRLSADAAAAGDHTPALDRVGQRGARIGSTAVPRAA